MRWWEKGVNSYSIYKYPIFNINPRLCLGRQVAIMEAKIVVIEFLNKFSFKLAENQEVKYVSSILLNMKDGMKIVLKERPVTTS